MPEPPVSAESCGDLRRKASWDHPSLVVPVSVVDVQLGRGLVQGPDGRGVGPCRQDGTRQFLTNRASQVESIVYSFSSPDSSVIT